MNAMHLHPARPLYRQAIGEECRLGGGGGGQMGNFRGANGQMSTGQMGQRQRQTEKGNEQIGWWAGGLGGGGLRKGGQGGGEQEWRGEDAQKN
jgi:hypothetical protein